VERDVEVFSRETQIQEGMATTEDRQLRLVCYFEREKRAEIPNGQKDC